jgi:hypothetical protein
MEDEDLRDFFAGMALMGLVMREGYNLAIEYDAYALADNMIKRKHDPDPYGKNDEDYVEDDPETLATAIKTKNEYINRDRADE